MLGVDKTAVDIIDAFAYFLPCDLVDFLLSFNLEVFVERFVGTNRVHGICHGIDVPVVGLDALIEDFGATTLLGDNRGHSALHSFEGRYTERF